jgi:predicted dehydrogenase
MGIAHRMPAPLRKLRLGFVGGAPPSFIGRVHRIAARYDDRFEIVAGVFSSNADSNRAAASELRIPPDRTYENVTAMLEGENRRADKIDVVAILTPNGSHFETSKSFAEHGYHILCEKPVTTQVADAIELINIQRRQKNVFVVAHAYTGYTMVRHARQLISEGIVGPLRVVQVEYAQGWLASAVELAGDKVARNRTDPWQNGMAGCLAAIGTHAFNVAAYVTGLELEAVSADLKAFVAGRAVPDNAHVMLRYGQAVVGSMWVSQVATGYGNSLTLRVIGESGTLEWTHDDPNRLSIRRSDGSAAILNRGGTFADGPLHAPAGHPEGFTDAFAKLYAGVADLIDSVDGGTTTPTDSFPVPTLIDGARAVCFASAALESSANGGTWTDARLDAPTLG